jgi:hypothetical protein
MRRLLASLSLVAVATSAAVPATATTHAHHARGHASHVHLSHQHRTLARRPACKVAPADEYFGRLKMSILGIRNTIKDQGLKIDIDPAKEPDTRGAIALTEDAIRDWQHKYPCDSWLPTTIFALEHFYAKIHTDDGVRHVHATFAWLRRSYPRAPIFSDAQREDAGVTAAVAGPGAGGTVEQTAVSAPSPRPRR